MQSHHCRMSTRWGRGGIELQFLLCSPCAQEVSNLLYSLECDRLYSTMYKPLVQKCHDPAYPTLLFFQSLALAGAHASQSVWAATGKRPLHNHARRRKVSYLPLPAPQGCTEATHNLAL